MHTRPTPNRLHVCMCVHVRVVCAGKGFTIPGVDSSGFRDQPAEFCGARVVSALSFGCPWYAAVPLSFALSPRIWWEVR